MYNSSTILSMIRPCEVSVDTAPYRRIIRIATPTTAIRVQTTLTHGMSRAIFTAVRLYSLTIHPLPTLTIHKTRYIVGKRKTGPCVLTPKTFTVGQDTGVACHTPVTFNRTVVWVLDHRMDSPSPGTPDIFGDPFTKLVRSTAMTVDIVRALNTVHWLCDQIGLQIWTHTGRQTRVTALVVAGVSEWAPATFSIGHTGETVMMAATVG